MSLRHKIRMGLIGPRVRVQSFIGRVLYRFKGRSGLGYSTNIAGDYSAGYGELSDNGFWQYPVPFEWTDVGKSILEEREV